MSKTKKTLIIILGIGVAICLLIAFLFIREKNDNGTHSGDDMNTSHTVTFLDLTGKLIEERTVVEGANVIPPKVPFLDGFVFKEWDKTLTGIQSDMECNAIYSEINSPSVAIENVYASSLDKTVSVNVYLLNNPGLSSVLFNLYYDAGLKLINVEFSSEFGEYITSPKPYSNPQTISMLSPFENIDYSGLMATLTFEVDVKSISDDYSLFEINVICNQDNTFNADYEDIVLEEVSGLITVIK